MSTLAILALSFLLRLNGLAPDVTTYTVEAQAIPNTTIARGLSIPPAIPTAVSTVTMPAPAITVTTTLTGTGGITVTTTVTGTGGITVTTIVTGTGGITATTTLTSTGTVTPETKQIGKIDMIRGLTLGAVAFLVGLLIGSPIINWLRDRRIGKHIRIEGPESHQIKTGTPTMGGLIFLIPMVIAISVFMDIPQFPSLLLPLGIVISCGILGGFDDLLSTVERNRGGLTARFKMAWLVAIAALTAYILYVPLGQDKLYFPFLTEPIEFGIFYIPIAMIAIVGMANAINITDGLDTLAGGTSAIAFVSYGIIAYLQDQAHVVALCFATVGALLAFLWFNAHPAQVFMGDAGSLTLGALLAVCALMTNQWILLPLIGIVFVAMVVSDILQVLYFKLTGGKRLFRMAPLHHHFEMLGWSETQITMRFWMVSIVAGMLGVALALV